MGVLFRRTVQRAVAAAGTAAALLLGCEASFEFDIPVASGGTSAGGGPESGGQAGLGGAAAGREGCGARNACPSPLVCADDECRECATSTDCTSGALSHCDAGRHRCVECTERSHCPEGSTCDLRANRCLVSCSERADCPVDAHGCDEARGVCYRCDEDYECAQSSLGPRCAIDGSACAECRSDRDCTVGYCDALSGRCVQCRDARDCASGLCDPTLHSCLSE